MGANSSIISKDIILEGIFIPHAVKYDIDNVVIECRDKNQKPFFFKILKSRKQWSAICGTLEKYIEEYSEGLKKHNSFDDFDRIKVKYQLNCSMRKLDYETLSKTRMQHNMVELEFLHSM